MRGTRSAALWLGVLLGLAALGSAKATASLAARHEHHDEPEGPYVNQFTNDEPIDSVMYLHMALQSIAWLVLFPTGMVLGLTKNKFHVPLQTMTCCISIFANWLGHHHHGRSFHSTAHSHSSKYMIWYMLSQAVMGAFLKAHVWEGTRTRRAVVTAHSVVGKSFPVFGWMMALFGAIAATGMCFGRHVAQCAAHGILGSGFVAYAILLVILMKLGQRWLARRAVSQEMIDSAVIFTLGIVTAFTEHNAFGQHKIPWNHKDLEHVSMGVLWWAGGFLGLVLSRNNRRSVVPALIIALTGYGMSAHAQPNDFSTTLHKFFGFTLGAAGVARMIEICFVLKDDPAPERPRVWQHVTPFFLTLGGLTFINSAEEEMSWLNESIMDETTFINGIASEAFVLYALAVGLVELFEYLNKPRDGLPDPERAVGDSHSPGAASSSWLQMAAQIPAFLSASAGAQRSRSGRSAGRGGEGEGYEAVPLTAAGASRDSHEADTTAVHPDRERTETRDSAITLFEVGEDEEDDGGDDYWEEKSVRRTQRA